MNWLIPIIVIVAVYWIYKYGKRDGSRKGFRAGRRFGRRRR